MLHSLPITLPPPLDEVLLPPIIIQSGVQLRGSDFGLDTVINDLPNTATVLSLGGIPLVPVPVHLTSMDLTLLGGAGMPPRPFMRNPTSCTTATTNFTADSYTAPGTTVTGSASFTPTNCGAQPFSPTFSPRLGAAGQTAAQSHPPVSTAIDQDVGEAGLRNATVLLPPNLSAELNVLSQTCDQAAFDAGNCPPNSIVGSAIATSPLLTEPLQGPVALIANPGLRKVGLDLRGPLAMKLVGGFVITPSGTGVAFPNLPDIPIGHFALMFNGGPNGLVATTADLCYVPSIFNASFDAWSGASQSGNTTAAVDGCGPPKPRRIKGSLRKARKLAIKTASPSLKLRIGRGKLTRTGPIGKRVKLKVKVVDAAGPSKTRTVKIRARG